MVDLLASKIVVHFVILTKR